jgi:hypothetical protein
MPVGHRMVCAVPHGEILMARFLPAAAREAPVAAEGDSLTHSLALIVTHAPTP